MTSYLLCFLDVWDEILDTHDNALAVKCKHVQFYVLLIESDRMRVVNGLHEQDILSQR